MTVHRIGIFDSGVGGLSVLAAVRAAMPDAELRYVADSGHAPYGERGDAHVVARARHIAAHLVAAGVQAIVIACNTATAAAADALRTAWPNLPVIGIEPGIKPACSASQNKRVGVMATAATLRSARFARLLETHRRDATIWLQPCTGLAAAIEAGRLHDPMLWALVERHCRPLKDAGVDTVVLGCTHYTFAHEAIRMALGDDVVLIDTADAVARQVAAVCAGLSGSIHYPLAAGMTDLQTSGDIGSLRRIARHWIGFSGEVSAWPDAA